MSSANGCPVCGKPVDPLRSRFVRVVGVKVTAYCSAECHQADGARVGAASSSAVPASTATKGEHQGQVDLGKPSGAGGKVDASVGKGEAKKPDAKAERAPAAESAGKPAKPEVRAESLPEAKAESLPEAKAGALPEVRAETKAAKTSGKAPGKTEDKTEAKAAKADSKAEAKSEGKVDPKTEAKSESKSPASPDPKAQGRAEAKPEGKGEGKVDGKPEGKAESKADGKPDPTTKAAKRDATSDKAPPASAKDLGGKDAQRGAKGSAGASRDGAAAPAKTERSASSAAEPPAAPARRSRALLVVALLAIVAVVGVGAWWMTRAEAPAAKPPAAIEQEPVKPAPPPPPPTFVPAEAHTRAVEVLRAHLAVESFRVRRVAAAALGRESDPQAISTLVELLPSEQSEIAKLDIAYGLARAKDPRGFEILLAGLKSARRDVKADAARLLAALKDARAESTLNGLAGLAQFRISANEQLGRLGNKPAITRLDKLRADPATSEEDRRRAAIALGYAGQAAVAPELRALLTDTSFNPGAAGALAVLGDAAARPVLEKQLEVSSLRVGAAVALRRLEPQLDAGKVLHLLMPDLESAKDTERVAAAEAVLVLTGPASVAEHD